MSWCGASAVLGDVAAVCAAADDDGDGGEGHGGQEHLSGVLDKGAVYGAVWEGGGGTHQGAELGVVGGADVDVAEGGGGGEKLVWDAAVGDGLPDEEGFGRRKGVEGLAAEGEDVCDEADAAGGGADEVEGFGVEEDGGVEEIAVLEAEFRGCVVEGAVLVICGVVAVEAAGGEAGWVGAEEARGLPGVDDSGEVGGEVGAAVDYPAYFLGLDWRGRYNACTQR